MTLNILNQKYKAILPIICCCMAYAMFNVNDAFIKFLGADLEVSQLMFPFFAVQLILSSILGWKKDGIRAFIPNNNVMFLRVILPHTVCLCNFLVLPKIELTAFYTIVFTSPFWVAIISSYFLKDRVGLRRMLVILVGFGAVVFAMNPFSVSVVNVWYLILLGGGIFVFSLDLVVLRMIGEKESKWFLVTSVSVVGVLIYSPIFYLNYSPLSLNIWGIIILMVIIQVIGFLALLSGYQNAVSASSVAPVHYTQMIWGTLIGYFVFSEVPTFSVIVGAIVIILSGIYLIYTENNSQKEELEFIDIQQEA